MEGRERRMPSQVRRVLEKHLAGAMRSEIAGAGVNANTDAVGCADDIAARLLAHPAFQAALDELQAGAPPSEASCRSQASRAGGTAGPPVAAQGGKSPPGQVVFTFDSDSDGGSSSLSSTSFGSCGMGASASGALGDWGSTGDNMKRLATKLSNCDAEAAGMANRTDRLCSLDELAKYQASDVVCDQHWPAVLSALGTCLLDTDEAVRHAATDELGRLFAAALGGAFAFEIASTLGAACHRSLAGPLAGNDSIPVHEIAGRVHLFTHTLMAISRCWEALSEEQAARFIASLCELCPSGRAEAADCETVRPTMFAVMGLVDPNGEWARKCLSRLGLRHAFLETLGQHGLLQRFLLILQSLPSYLEQEMSAQGAESAEGCGRRDTVGQVDWTFLEASQVLVVLEILLDSHELCSMLLLINTSLAVPTAAAQSAATFPGYSCPMTRQGIRLQCSGVSVSLQDVACALSRLVDTCIRCLKSHAGAVAGKGMTASASTRQWGTSLGRLYSSAVAGLASIARHQVALVSWLREQGTQFMGKEKMVVASAVQAVIVVAAGTVEALLRGGDRAAQESCGREISGGHERHAVLWRATGGALILKELVGGAEGGIVWDDSETEWALVASAVENLLCLIPLISLSDVGEARGLSLGGNRDETLWAMIIEPLGMLASTDSMMLHRLMWRAGGWNRWAGVIAACVEKRHSQLTHQRAQSPSSLACSLHPGGVSHSWMPRHAEMDLVLVMPPNVLLSSKDCVDGKDRKMVFSVQERGELATIVAARAVQSLKSYFRGLDRAAMSIWGPDGLVAGAEDGAESLVVDNEEWDGQIWHDLVAYFGCGLRVPDGGGSLVRTLTALGFCLGGVCDGSVEWAGTRCLEGEDFCRGAGFEAEEVWEELRSDVDGFVGMERSWGTRARWHLDHFLSWVQLTALDAHMTDILVALISQASPDSGGRAFGDSVSALRGLTPCSQCVEIIGLRVLVALTGNLDSWVAILAAYPRLRVSLVQALVWSEEDAQESADAGERTDVVPSGPWRGRRSPNVGGFDSKELWDVNKWGGNVRQDCAQAWVRDPASVMRDLVLGRGTILPCISRTDASGKKIKNDKGSEGEDALGLVGLQVSFWDAVRELGESGGGAEEAPVLNRGGGCDNESVTLEEVLHASAWNVCDKARRFLRQNISSLDLARTEVELTDARGSSQEAEAEVEGAGANEEAGLLMWLLFLRVASSAPCGWRATGGTAEEFREALTAVSFMRRRSGTGIDWWAATLVVVGRGRAQEALTMFPAAGGAGLGDERMLAALVDVLAGTEIPSVKNRMRLRGRPVRAVACVWLQQCFLTVLPFEHVVQTVCVTRVFGPLYAVYLCLAILGRGCSGQGRPFSVAQAVPYLHELHARYGDFSRRFLETTP